MSKFVCLQIVLQWKGFSPEFRKKAQLLGPYGQDQSHALPLVMVKLLVLLCQRIKLLGNLSHPLLQQIDGVIRQAAVQAGS
jgi:hypothetical protein